MIEPNTVAAALLTEDGPVRADYDGQEHEAHRGDDGEHEQRFLDTPHTPTRCLSAARRGSRHVGRCGSGPRG